MLPDEFHTSDLGQAAYLLAQGHSATRLDGPPGRRVFVFPAEVREEAERFYLGATVTAQIYANAIRAAKQMIRQS